MKKFIIPILIIVGFGGFVVAQNISITQNDDLGRSTISTLPWWTPTSTTQGGVAIDDSIVPRDDRNAYIEGSATTTDSLTVGSLTSGNCVQAGAGGLLQSAGAACGSGSGGSSNWQAFGSDVNILTPTTTNAAILVTSASSTITTLRVPNNFFATTSLIDTLTLTNDLTVANGGTGASTLTGCLDGNGTGAFTASGVDCATVVFTVVQVTGQDPIVADGIADTLNITAGTSMSISANDASDTVTINTIQGIRTADSPTFAGLTLTGNLLVNAASSTITNLTVSDSATTTTLIIGVDNYPTLNLIDGDLWAKRATTSNLTVTTLNETSCDLKADTSGNFYCGLDANSGGGGGSNWQAFQSQATVLTPTTTDAGILVTASSTISGGLKIIGQATSTTLIVGTGYPATNLSSGTLAVGSGSDTNPSIIFISDTTTGFYNAGLGGTIGVTNEGTQRWEFNADGLVAKNSALLKISDGSGTSPGIQFSSDANVGIYRLTTDILGISAGGSKVLIGTASSTIATNLTISGNATTSGYLVVGTTNPTLNLPVGGLWAGAATTTNLGVSSLAIADCDVKATTAGSVYCGTDATGGGGAYAWTDTSTYGQKASATTTAVWFQATPFSMFASSTIVVEYATTTKNLDVLGAIETPNITVTTAANLSGASITNFFGTACADNNWLQDIGDDGTFTCGALDVTGAWTGTFDGQQGTYYLDWDNFTDKPATSTVVVLLDSDYRIAELHATTTEIDALTVNTTSVLANATSTHLAVTTLASCTAIETNSDGTFLCGSDDTGGVGAFAWTDQGAYVSTSTAVALNNGLMVNASSTLTSDIRSQGNLFATTTLTDNLTVVTALNLNGASITNHYGTACAGNNWLQDISDAGVFSCGALDVTGDWTGTLDGNDASDLAAAWELYSTSGNGITPTSSEGIIVTASSTITTLAVTDFLRATSSLDFWFNATSTWAGFQSEFNTKFNATSTWASFLTNFNTYLNATTTLDLTNFSVVTATTTQTLRVGTLTDGIVLSVNGIEFFGSAKPSRVIVLTGGGGIPTYTDAGTSTTSQNYVLFTNNRQTLVSMDFPSSTSNNLYPSAQWTTVMPDSYDGGTFTAQVISTATTTAGNVKWCIRAVAYASTTPDTALIDATWGTAQCWSNQTIATANNMVFSTSTSEITVGGTPGANAVIQWQVYRWAQQDNRANYGRLIMVNLNYKSNKLSD